MRDSWFSRIVGFDETEGPDTVRSRLRIVGGCLCSDASGRAPHIGTLTLPSLAELRAMPLPAAGGSLYGRVGEARALHAEPELNGALFQVASQFNLLEMVSPNVTPEDGVARYEHDRTQGPACAMAAGAATIYRNYLVPIGDQVGQDARVQLDAAADLGLALAEATGLSVDELWHMSNGYALVTERGLTRVAEYLSDAGEDELDALRGRLRIGLVTDAEVTDVAGGHQRVSQALCSAFPIAYSAAPNHPGWEPLARLVLDATYEATLLAARANPRSNRVLLTAVGGGVFGNHEEWIAAAVRRAMHLVSGVEAEFVGHTFIPRWAARLAGQYPPASLLR